MSYLGDADGAFYVSNSAVNILPNQPLFLHGWINLLSFPTRAGLVTLSNSTTSSLRLSLSVLSSNRIDVQFSTSGLRTPLGQSVGLQIGTWAPIGAYLSQGLNGVAQLAKIYKDGSVSSANSTLVPPDYGTTPLNIVQAGDGAFAETRHRGALLGVWSPANEAAADQLAADLASMLPEDVGGAIGGPWNFLDAVPAGFVASGAISIDTNEQPPIFSPSFNIPHTPLGEAGTLPTHTLNQSIAPIEHSPLPSPLLPANQSIGPTVTSQPWSDGTLFTDGTGWAEFLPQGISVYHEGLSAPLLPADHEFQASLQKIVQLPTLFPSPANLPTHALTPDFPTTGPGIGSLLGESDKAGIELGLGLGL